MVWHLKKVNIRSNLVMTMNTLKQGLVTTEYVSWAESAMGTHSGYSASNMSNPDPWGSTTVSGSGSMDPTHGGYSHRSTHEYLWVTCGDSLLSESEGHK